MKEIILEIKFRMEAYEGLKNAMFKRIQDKTADTELINAYHIMHNKWSEYGMAYAALTQLQKSVGASARNDG